MISKFKCKVLSLFMAALLTVSLMIVWQLPMQAASQAVSVTIADVKQKYKDMKKILDMINSERNTLNRASLTMDTNLMNKALVRAAELSVYASVVRPDGTSYVDNCSQLIGYNVLSNASIVNQWQSGSDSSSIFYASNAKSIGIGVVEVAGYKHVCVLISNNDASSEVEDSVLSQSNKTINQTISVLPSNISNVKVDFSDGLSLMCGSSVPAYLYVTNKLYTTVGATLTADNMNVSISNKCFTYTYNTITAVSPGEATVTITCKESSAISASAKIKAVALSMDDCFVAAIPDQYYTGQAITPTITVKDADGALLTQGTDYTVSYSNNVQIGTATVTVTGKGKYAGATKKTTFNIVMNQGSAFAITAKLSSSSLIVGQSATVSVTNSGGVTPVKYTYDYAVAGTTSWKTIAAATTTASANFKPTAAQNYSIRVTAVDNAGRTASQTLSLKVEDKLSGTVSFNKASFTLGEKVVITAAHEGSASVTYAFYIKSSSVSSWTTLQDFSAVAYYNYVPKTPGEYDVLVKFKSSSGQTAEVYKTLKVTGTALSNTSSVSGTSVSFGKSVTLKGSASGGSGSYQYGYYYKLSDASTWTTLKGFSTTSSVDFKPSATGTYDVCVKVQDSTGNIVKKYLTVKCSQAFSNTSTLSAAKINLGKTITVNASSNASGTCTYGVWYHTKGTDGWSVVQNYASASKVNITPTKSGNFEVCVRVKDSTGAIAVKYLNFTVNPKLVNSSKLSASSINTGASVTVTCAASGGAGSYTYLVQYRKSGTSSWTVKQNYSSNASVSLPFSSAGAYEIGVNVKDALGDVVSVTKNLTVKTPITAKLTLAKTSIVCGQSNTVTATASGGTGGLTYGFYYKLSAAEQWTTKQDFKTNAKVDIKPAKAGTYDVCVKVKDSSGTVQKVYTTFKVTEAVKVTGSLSASTIVQGQSTTVTAKASAGSGTGYTYAIYLKQSTSSSWTEKQDFKANASLSLKPANSGTYEVCVKAKDSIGGIAKVYLTITVKPSVKLSMSTTAGRIVKGHAFTVTAKASLGSGTGYTYACYLRQAGSSKWVTKQDFSSNSTFSVKTANAGKYELCVKVKDSIGGMDKAYFTFTAQPVVENTSTVSATSVKVNGVITVTASAQYGWESYTYSVLYRKSGSSSWKTVQDYNGNKVVKIIPDTAGSYEICVKVKDTLGDISKKYFTVTVTK